VSTAPNRQTMSDAELIAASRTGDGDAFGELYRRHVPAARAAARAMCRNRSDADDLVSEAFLNVLRTLQNGNGPELAFRPYLLVAVRNRFYDRMRRKQEDPADEPTDELNLALIDSATIEEDKMLAAAAFGTLPERWQLVLWHTEIEGRTPAEIAPLLGLAPNSVAALAYRAREGLRQAYLQAHLQTPREVDCRECVGHLGAYVRDSLSDRDRRKVDEHLAGCESCRALLAELTDTNVMLRAALIPAIVGIPAAAYLSGLGGKGVVAWFARASRLHQVGAAAAVAAATVAAVVTVAIVSTGGGNPTIAAPPTTRPRVELGDVVETTSSIPTQSATATSTGTTVQLESLAPVPPTVPGSLTGSPATSSTVAVNRVPVPQGTPTTEPTTTAAVVGTSTTPTSTTPISATSTVPTTTVPVIPRLALTSIQLGLGLLGGEVRVQVTVSATALPTNQFRTNAFANLVVNVPLPAGVSLAGADNTAWSCTAQGMCTIAALSSGESSTAVLRLRLALDAALPISLTPIVMSPANAVVQSQTLSITTGTIPGLQTQEFARGSVAAVGNTVIQDCVDAIPLLHCYADVDADKSTFNSSTADLQFTGSVAKAVLVWSGDSESQDRDKIKFLTPHGALDIVADQVATGYSAGYKSAYTAYVDITGWISSSGVYGVADLQTSLASYGGWSLIVLAHDDTQPLRSLMIALPMSYVTSDAPASISLSGSSMTSMAHVIVSAFEGDKNFLGSLQLNGIDLGINPFHGGIAGGVDLFDTTASNVAAGAVTLDFTAVKQPVTIAAVGIALDVW
jgi:RNA polymerase sigma factor (sigma-70 family)